ncbi:Crp/Fnr family transcriptional regulator [Planobispora takensis]|uniref:Crp/Fnr family transcriptional regulator n=1 Tax=Planobispora takensis TaxID=1367882 RepID=UPI0035A24253
MWGGGRIPRGSIRRWPNPPGQRLGQCVLQLGRRHGRHQDDHFEISIPITQQDLAGWAGVSRKTVERVLRSWRRRGVVATHRRKVIVPKMAMLLSMAGNSAHGAEAGSGSLASARKSRT